MAATSGSVGHLVAASLETSGHYLQSYFLDLFNGPFGQSLGIFIFVISALVGLTTGIVSGKFNSVLWFLIGPIMFWAVTMPRAESYGAEWRFGVRRYPQQLVMLGSQAPKKEEYTPTGRAAQITDPARVSLLFSIWNRVVSGTVNTLVSIVENVSENGDVTFLAKGERYNLLMHPKVRDSTMLQFVTLTAVEHCSAYYRALSEYYNPGINDLQRRRIKERLDTQATDAIVTIEEQSALFNWLTKVGVTIPTGTTQVSCSQLWQIGTEVFKRESVSWINEIADVNRPEGLSREEVVTQLSDKFKTSIKHNDNYIETIDTNQQMLLMINEVAGRMFLSELRKMHPAVNQRDFNVDRPDEYNGMDSTPTKIADNMRTLMKVEEYEEKGDYLMATLALPYVQGMILYVLSLLFPFFAFSLLIPGKQGGFLIWFGLWVWAKSWDVFFSFVMLIDNILYHLLPHGPPVFNDVLASPKEAFKAILEVDPNYSVYTYYHILALCLASIPIISGFLVKRGGSDFVDALGANLTQFSGRAGEAMALYSRNLKSQSDLRQSMLNGEAAVDRASATLLKDPIVQAAMARIRHATAASALLGAAGNAPSLRNQNSLNVPGLTVHPGNQAKAIEALASASSEQAAGILDARVKQLMTNARYMEGLGAHNRKMAKRAIMLGFNSHDLMDPVLYPGEAEANLTKAYYTSNLEGAWNKSVQGAWVAMQRGNDFVSPAFLQLRGPNGIPVETTDPMREYFRGLMDDWNSDLPKPPDSPLVYSRITGRS